MIGKQPVKRFPRVVDQVPCRAFARSSAFGTVRGAGYSFRNWGAAGDLDASARLRRIRAVLGAWGLRLARGGAGAGSLLGRARAALSLRSEDRARLGDRRNQGASYRLKEGDRNGKGPQTGW